MKKLANRVSNFLDRISLDFKTKILMIISVTGMISLGFIYYTTLFSMKYDFDQLYNKRTLSVIKLEKIKDLYQINIHDTFLEVLQHKINEEDAQAVVYLALDQIESFWDEYRKNTIENSSNIRLELIKNYLQDILFFKFEYDLLIDEKDLFQKTQNQIKIINKTIEKIFHFYKTRDLKGSQEIILQDLFPTITSLNIKLSHTISVLLELAIIDKEYTDKLYNISIFITIIAILIIIAISILLSMVILKNIEAIHHSLEDRVFEKTSELQFLNQTLEKRVKKEIDKSRKKDNIMYQQARLAAMGEMIGNIAHQWRQPLNALMVLIQSFETKNLVGKLDNNFIEMQVKEGLRISTKMSQTIEDFRNFFKPNKIKEEFDIDLTINDSLSLLTLFLKDFNVVKEYKNFGELRCHGFSNAFSQVIVNILNNAKDILNNSKQSYKEIFIITSKIQKDEITYAQIAIYDNGGGIINNNIDRIFEPYFTTKHQAHGTGIGLYMSKQIIEDQMNGIIYAKNEEHIAKDDKLYNCAVFIIKIPI